MAYLAFVDAVIRARDCVRAALEDAHPCKRAMQLLAGAIWACELALGWQRFRSLQLVGYVLTFAGTLAAVDGSLRTLCVWLTRALTPRTGSNAAETTQTRTLGMVLIPDKHRVGFEVEATDEERLEWMSLGD